MRRLRADYLKCTDTHCHECDYSVTAAGRDVHVCALLSMDVDRDDKGQPLRAEVCLEFGCGPTSKPVEGLAIDCTETHCAKCEHVAPRFCGLISVELVGGDNPRRNAICRNHDTALQGKQTGQRQQEISNA